MSSPQPRQGEVWVANLDPTIGDEIRKRRPALVLSRDEINSGAEPGRRVAIVAPMTTTPTTGAVEVLVPAHDGHPARKSYVLPWQLRAISGERLARRVMTVDRATLEDVSLRARLLISVPRA